MNVIATEEIENSMYTITLSDVTYRWLERKAQESARAIEQVADELLLRQLMPKHAYVEVVDKPTGTQALIKDTRVPVSIIIGYLRMGETPESLTTNILPSLTLAQIYDALSYYYDHRGEIEQELQENTEEWARAYLKRHLGVEGYQRVTGQAE